jgi:hypothetical protein
MGLKCMGRTTSLNGIKPSNFSTTLCRCEVKTLHPIEGKAPNPILSSKNAASKSELRSSSHMLAHIWYGPLVECMPHHTANMLLEPLLAARSCRMNHTRIPGTTRGLSPRFNKGSATNSRVTLLARMYSAAAIHLGAGISSYSCKRGRVSIHGSRWLLQTS